MIRDVLEVISSGEKKLTRIMLYSGLSWSQLKRTLKTLIEKGYVKMVKVSDLKSEKDKRSNNFYKITPSGHSLLKNLKSTLQMNI